MPGAKRADKCCKAKICERSDPNGVGEYTLAFSSSPDRPLSKIKHDSFFWPFVKCVAQGMILGKLIWISGTSLVFMHGKSHCFGLNRYTSAENLATVSGIPNMTCISAASAERCQCSKKPIWDMREVYLI